MIAAKLRVRWALLFGLLPLCTSCPSGSKPPRSVLLVILDTVRADHLSCYGYERETTPHLDRLAAEGERFEEAYSQAPWTLPSIATILTGQPPHVHGAGFTKEGIFAVRTEVPTLAERLGPRGYRRAAFINVVWCNPRSGLARGFDLYDFQASDETNQGTRDAARTTDAALAWLSKQGGAPFFLVVHYFDAHLTYDPPPPFDAMFEPDAQDAIGRGFGSASEVFAIRDGRLQLSARQRQSLIARHDGELRYADEQFGRLRAALERLELWENTVVVVAADHGEEFWDHGGFEHGHSHHRELLRVPLILKRPGGQVGVVHEKRTRLVDIVPSILDAIGATVPADLPGQILGQGAAAPSIAEGSLWSGDLVSIRSDHGTLILDRPAGHAQFFRADDPAETRPLPAAGAEAEALVRALRALPPQPSRAAPPWHPTEEQLEQLRSLGYVR